MSSTFNPDLHLFVDDQNIYQAYGVTRVLNRGTKMIEPIITSSWKPGRMAAAWGNVIQEADGRLRMWYVDVPTDGHGETRQGTLRDIDTSFMCYAESTDGIDWVKPELGLIEFQGSKANNIVMNGFLGAQSTDGAITNFDGFTIIRDEEEPDPEKRYKMIAHWESVHLYDRYIHGKEISDEQLVKHHEAQRRYITTSPDGIHWRAPVIPLHRGEYGDRLLVNRDERNGRWWMSDRPRMSLVPDMGMVRAAGLSYSSDLVNWTSPNELVLAPDEEDAFGSITQFHTFFPFNYGNQDLGYLSTVNFRGGGVQTYLLSHRDGQPWQRIFRREPVLEHGAPGSFDREMAVPLHNVPIVIGDEMVIYYTAGTTRADHPAGQRSIALARYRRDGFVGIASGGLGRTQDNRNAGEAYVTTRLVKVNGGVLKLNIETINADGHARVALLNPDMSMITGFSLTDCDIIKQDSVSATVSWQGKVNLEQLRGKQVMLHISYANAVLYSYLVGE